MSLYYTFQTFHQKQKSVGFFFYGVSTSESPEASEIENMQKGVNTNTLNEEFSITSGNNEYIYIAYPSGWGIPSIFDKGVSYYLTLPLLKNVVINNLFYNVYKTKHTNLADCSFKVIKYNTEDANQ